MKVNFFGPDPAYHEARRRFVFKGNPPPQQSRVPVSAQIELSPGALGKAVAPPMPQDFGWSTPSRSANGSTHVSELEHDEISDLTGETWGTRVLGMLRRGVAAVQPRRDQ